MSNRIWNSDSSVKRDDVFKKDEQQKIVDKLRFLDNYNLWLETRHEGMKVKVTAIGIGNQNDVCFDGIVFKETEKHLIVDVDFRTGAAARVCFFRARTMTQGYPRSGELFISPTKEEPGLLAQRLNQMAERASVGKLGQEQVFDFNSYTTEMERE